MELAVNEFDWFMKLSHKIGKIFSRETHVRALRRLQRRLHPISIRSLLGDVDRVRLQEIEARYARSTSDSEKYRKYLAAFERWLEVNVQRAQDLQLHRSPPQAILDIGCGGGFFLFVCQRLGHRCLGLDTCEDPLFSDLIELFQVERKIYTILPFEPLPDLSRKL